MVVTVVVTPTSAPPEVVVTTPTDVDTLLFVDAGSMTTGVSTVDVLMPVPSLTSVTTFMT